MGSGERWTPDARVWNMSEGSFDQREAIFAPTPASIAFRTTLPPNAKFVFSPATANDNGDATVFTVSITDARGQKTTPYEKRFLPEQSSRLGRRSDRRSLCVWWAVRGAAPRDARRPAKIRRSGKASALARAT